MLPWDKSSASSDIIYSVWAPCLYLLAAKRNFPLSVNAGKEGEQGEERKNKGGIKIFPAHQRKCKTAITKIVNYHQDIHKILRFQTNKVLQAGQLRLGLVNHVGRVM